MIIKSPVKDYYDHVGYQYGATPDNSTTTYVRGEIKKQTTTVVGSFGSFRDSPGGINDWKELQPWLFRWCIVNGRYYLIVADNNYQMLSDDDLRPFRIFTPKHPAAQWLIRHPDPDHMVFEKRWMRYMNKGKDIDYYLGREGSELITLSRDIGEPVFAIKRVTWNRPQRNYTVEIYSKVPNLGEMGFGSIIPAEQMWQDLYYFLANRINPSPDMMPPSKMTDKEKIVGHGFDFVQSFRHRK